VKGGKIERKKSLLKFVKLTFSKRDAHWRGLGNIKKNNKILQDTFLFLDRI